MPKETAKKQLLATYRNIFRNHFQEVKLTEYREMCRMINSGLSATQLLS